MSDCAGGSARRRLNALLFRKSASELNVHVPLESKPVRSYSCTRRISPPILSEWRPTRYVAMS